MAKRILIDLLIPTLFAICIQYLAIEVWLRPTREMSATIVFTFLVGLTGAVWLDYYLVKRSSETTLKLEMGRLLLVSMFLFGTWSLFWSIGEEVYIYPISIGDPPGMERYIYPGNSGGGFAAGLQRLHVTLTRDVVIGAIAGWGAVTFRLIVDFFRGRRG